MTAKASVDKHPQWRAFQRGRKIQSSAATNLHLEAYVPFGPCGYDELSCFALVLVDANRAYHCANFGQGDKLLGILHKDGHYDALTSLPGFFGKSYFCARCFRPYDNEGQHACTNNAANHCGSCLQEGCSDHAKAYRARRRATLECSQCGRRLYGETCMEAHRLKSHDGKPVGPDKPSVCSKRRKCRGCRKLLRGRKEIHYHKCNHVTCKSCKQYVDVNDHKCFIQIAPTPQQLKEERKKKKSVVDAVPLPGYRPFAPTIPSTPGIWSRRKRKNPCMFSSTSRAFRWTRGTCLIWRWPKRNSTTDPYVSVGSPASEISWSGSRP